MLPRQNLKELDSTTSKHQNKQGIQLALDEKIFNLRQIRKLERGALDILDDQSIRQFISKEKMSAEQLNRLVNNASDILHYPIVRSALVEGKIKTEQLYELSSSARAALKNSGIQSMLAENQLTWDQLFELSDITSKALQNTAVRQLYLGGKLPLNNITSYNTLEALYLRTVQQLFADNSWTLNDVLNLNRNAITALRYSVVYQLLSRKIWIKNNLLNLSDIALEALGHASIRSLLLNGILNFEQLQQLIVDKEDEIDEIAIIDEPVVYKLLLDRVLTLDHIKKLAKQEQPSVSNALMVIKNPKIGSLLENGILKETDLYQLTNKKRKLLLNDEFSLLLLNRVFKFSEVPFELPTIVAALNNSNCRKLLSSNVLTLQQVIRMGRLAWEVISSAHGYKLLQNHDITINQLKECEDKYSSHPNISDDDEKTYSVSWAILNDTIRPEFLSGALKLEKINYALHRLDRKSDDEVVKILLESLSDNSSSEDEDESSQKRKRASSSEDEEENNNGLMQPPAKKPHILHESTLFGFSPASPPQNQPVISVAEAKKLELSGSGDSNETESSDESSSERSDDEAMTPEELLQTYPTLHCLYKEGKLSHDQLANLTKDDIIILDDDCAAALILHDFFTLDALLKLNKAAVTAIQDIDIFPLIWDGILTTDDICELNDPLVSSLQNKDLRSLLAEGNRWFSFHHIRELEGNIVTALEMPYICQLIRNGDVLFEEIQNLTNDQIAVIVLMDESLQKQLLDPNSTVRLDDILRRSLTLPSEDPNLGSTTTQTTQTPGLRR